MTDLPTHPAEVLVDHVTVGGPDGVRVEFYHHKSWNTATERVYRLRRTDTCAERMVSHPLSDDPIKPALARQALAEWFVSYPSEAMDALDSTS